MKKYKYDITIAILNYNGLKYLDRAIRSCLDQILSHKTHQVILIDDNSTDSSLSYIKKNDLLKKMIKIYKNKKNMGADYSSNYAVQKAEGKYFMRVDADDFISRYALEIMTEILNNNDDIGYVYCDHHRTDEFGFKTKVVKLDSKKKLYAHGAGILFRTDLIKKVGNYKKNLREAEDHDLLIRLNKITRGFHLPLPLYRYYIHGKNISIIGNRSKYLSTIYKNVKKI